MRASGATNPTYIVKFNDNVTDVPALARRLAAANGGTIRYTYQRALKGFAASLSPTAAASLARNPSVAFVEADQIFTIQTTQTGATWGLDRSDQRALPLSTTYSYTKTGAGVTAYIIDTGILFGHTDFGGRAVDGYDAVNVGTPADDCNGHGTHVAGTVGGLGVWNRQGSKTRRGSCARLWWKWKHLRSSGGHRLGDRESCGGRTGSRQYESWWQRIHSVG
jgi:subtilisin family serine protease